MRLNDLTRQSVASIGWGRLLSNCVCAMLLLIPAGVYAQSRTIMGTVTDDVGAPVIGATVTIDGSSTGGTVTGANGMFRLPGVNGDVNLSVSIVGYETVRQVAPAGSVQVNFTLKPLAIEEVVVVAYGTQALATVTGSVTAVKSDELVATVSQNVQNMMTGKLPGVRVTQKTSEPGEFNNQFDIRGFDAPLIIIDGVPRGDFDRIDPDDIESISILKDASAAIYGVRSANGVVLVTTKRGTGQKPSIEYSMNWGMQFPAELLQPVGTYDRYVLLNEQSMRSTNNPTPPWSDQVLQEALDGTRPSTDWYSEVLRKWAPQQQHNLSVRGGNETTDYYINFGWQGQDGFFKSDDYNYERYNIRSNINAKLSKNLTVSARISGMIDRRERPSAQDTWDVFKWLWRSLPSETVYANNTAPYYSSLSPSDNPNVAASTEKDAVGYNLNMRKVFNSNFEATYQIPGVEGLAARAMFAYDNSMSDDTRFRKVYQLYSYTVDGTYANTQGPAINNSSIRRYYGGGFTRLWNAGLTYNRKFKEIHRVNAMALFETSHSMDDNFQAERELVIPLPYLSVGQTTNQIGQGSTPGENAYQSFVGRVEYGLKDRYLLEANVRYDGSSKFMPGNKWDFFWGALAGWRISEESFIKDNASWINNLKLRLSFAKLGDDSLNFYNYLGGYNYPGAVNNSHNGYPGGYFFNGVFINSLSTRDTPNPSIGWIKIYSANIGLDAEFWNGKLGFSIDFFQRSRDGLVARRGAILPNTFGAGVAEENLNGDRTSGYEVQVSHRNRVGEFFYELDANMSYTRTLRTARPAQEIRQSSRAYWRNNEENRYGDIMFGIGDWGRYGSYDEIFNDYYANGDVLPGDYRYEDWNDDGVIDDDDQHPIALTNPGNSFGQRRGPLMFFALNTRFGWKGIDLDLNFQGATMAWAGYGEAISQPLLWNGNALDYHMDRWRPVDPKADPYNPSTEWQTGRWSYGANKALPRDNSRAGIQNGTYLRLKTITLGYTLPAQITSKAGINNLRLYVSGYNMLTFTGMEGLDPEKPGDQGGYTYPLNKTVSFGASLKF